jgi:hypothetical protein
MRVLGGSAGARGTIERGVTWTTSLTFCITVFAGLNVRVLYTP